MMRSPAWNELNTIYWKGVKSLEEVDFLEPQHTMLQLVHEFAPREGDAAHARILRVVGRRSVEYQKQMDALYQKVVTGLKKNNFPNEHAKRITLCFFQMFEPIKPE